MSRANESVLGLALSAADLCVVQQGTVRPSTRRVTLAATPGDNGAWPALTAALRDVAPDEGTRVAIALLPPLVEVRRLELPPLDESELLQLLTRNASRYFVAARGPQTIGVLRGRGKRGAPHGILAAAAPARIVAGIHAAARDAGVIVTSITPAEAAWAAAALDLWPAFGRRAAHLLVHEADRTLLVEVDGGSLTNVRRFRAGDADAELIAAAITEGASGGVTPIVGSFGAVTTGRDLLRALSSRGIIADAAPAVWADDVASPEVMAAAFAQASAGPLLITESGRSAQSDRLKHAMRWVMAAAAVLFIASPLVALWGVHRELAKVQADRVAIHSEVAATLVGRSSVEDAYRRLAAIIAAQKSAPHWASVLADLSDRLPDDAYFTTFRTRADTVVVDGLAAHAALAFDAIDGSVNLRGVRAPAPVRREAPEGGEPMERFTLSATLRGSAPIPLTGPPAAGATRRPASGQGAP